MTVKRVQGVYQRTPEQKAADRKIHEKFRDWRPTIDELLESGEYEDPLLTGHYFDLRRVVARLRKGREAAGLSLADVSDRCGIDRAALNKLELGKSNNPTLNTLYRYAAAVGLRITLSAEAGEGPPDANSNSLPARVQVSELAQDVIRRRRELGLGQAALARRAGVRRETVRLLESGEHVLGAATVAKVEQALRAAEREQAAVKAPNGVPKKPAAAHSARRRRTR